MSLQVYSKTTQVLSGVNISKLLNQVVESDVKKTAKSMLAFKLCTKFILHVIYQGN